MKIKPRSESENIGLTGHTRLNDRSHQLNDLFVVKLGLFAFDPAFYFKVFMIDAFFRIGIP